MVEHTAFPRISLPGDIDACLLVEPPTGQPEIVSYMSGFLKDDSVRHEHGIDIACHAGSVVCHGPADKPLAQGGEGAFQFSTPQEDIVGLTHAASKSLADR
jgi:hypothetical protein